jgi:hypothetical protein
MRPLGLIKQTLCSLDEANLTHLNTIGLLLDRLSQLVRDLKYPASLRHCHNSRAHRLQPFNCVPHPPPSVDASAFAVLRLYYS